MSNLFISHSSSDNEAARELQRRLKEKKHKSVFLDFDPEMGIQAGVSWERTLYTKLRSCRAVVALCSANYLASQWCFAEIALARMEGKELFTLQIDPWGEETRLPSILTEEQYIDLRTDPDAGYERLWNAFEAKGIVPEEHRQLRPGMCPYPGLRAFDAADAPIFFGRDAEVRDGVELLNRVRRQGHPRLVMVLGSSGSGKSSLARAGIVPQLRRDPATWRVVGPFRPGRRPAVELAQAFAGAFKEAGKPRSREEILERLDRAAIAPSAAGDGAPEGGAGEAPSAREMLREALRRMEGELAAEDSQLTESAQRLNEYLDRTAEEAPRSDGAARRAGPESNPLAALAGELRLAGEHSEARVLLVIDQFEELLGLEDEGDDHPANRLLRLLREGIESEDEAPLALGTMRSDFLGILQRSGPLRGVGFKSLSVGPMSEEGMLRVIEEPATLGGIDLEKPELTHRLLRETGTADALPLLAFTLRAMWDRYHESKRFDVQGYEALGGLQGAIAQVADDTMEAALAKSEDGTEKDLRIAFLSLARPAAEGTGWARQPASWDEMPERVRPMIQQFIDQRLLVKRADGTVEVAHEALFRSWKTLRDWLNANAEGLHLRREIRVDAEKWERAEGDEKGEYLWRGGRLARALELRDRGVLRLTELDTTFIEASEADERRLREKEEEERQAKLEAARKLAEAERARAEEQSRRAEEQRRAARRNLALLIVAGFLAVVAGISFWIAREKRKEAEDQARLAVASNWLERDPTKAALVLLEVRRPERTGLSLQLMSDALRQPLALFELRGHGDAVTGAEFSPDGKRIVTASKDKTARIWTLSDDGAGDYHELPHPEPVLGASFHPETGLAVLTVAQDAARLWRLSADGSIPEGGIDPVVIAHEGHELVGAAFDPRGERIVTAANRTPEAPPPPPGVRPPFGVVKVWKADGTPYPSADEALELPHQWPVSGAAFSPEGDRIVSGSGTSALIWDAESGDAKATLEGHGAGVLRAVYDPRGEQIATASLDDTARIWSPAGDPLPAGRPAEMRHGGDIYHVAFSPEGDRIVTSSDDFTARVWRADGRPARSPDSTLQIVLRHESEVNASAFSPSGDRIVTASKDRTARVWSARGGSEPLVLKHKDAISTAFGPEGTLLTASMRRNAIIWEVERRAVSKPDDEFERPVKRREVEFEGTSNFVSVVVDPAGERFLTASQDGVARVWGSDGKPLAGVAAITHGGAPLNHAGFDPKGVRIVTSSGDGSARLWNADGTPLEGAAPMSHGEAPVDYAEFNRAGNRVVTASQDGTARLWDAPNPPASTAGGPGRTGVMEHAGEAVTRAVFDPRGRWIVTTSGLLARLWNADGSGPLERDWRHDHPVLAAAFSPSGDRVVTGSVDEFARVWNTEGGGDPLVLVHSKFVSGAAFAPEGDRALTLSQFSGGRLWTVSSGLLAAKVRAVTSICLDAGFRVKSLSEPEPLAERRARECAECLEAFYDQASAAGLKGAFEAYQQCVR